MKFEAAKGYYEYAHLLKLTLREDEAKSNFETAYHMFHKMGASVYERKCADFLGIDYRGTNIREGLSKEIRNYQRMSSFMELIRNISSILEMNTLLDKVLMTVIEVSGAQNGCLMIKNSKSGKLEILAQKITSGSINDISDEIIRNVYEKGEAIISTNVADEEKYSIYQSMLINGVKSVLCLPIKSNEEIVGICYLENKLSSAVFSPEDIDMLNSLLAQAAISIENARLYKIATTDGLTGLISHRHFKFILEKEIERCKKHKKIFSLIMFDIDHFKNINDTYGHQAGDLVLSNVAMTMKKVFRNSDIIARYEGDEMAIILPETDEASTLEYAQMLIDTIKETEIQYEGNRIMITISAGIASYPKHATSPATLIKAADTALYRSKAEGRDRVTQYYGDYILYGQ
ncbi:MAG TPA: sensor domain-containing diguanylate cyclase [Pseudobacteroides sp.]|nr:sensor domain-containing diguanylate cyclase [Pseudobacteroides sp.]